MEPDTIIKARAKSSELFSFVEGFFEPLKYPTTYLCLGAGVGLVVLSGGTGLVAVAAEALVDGAAVVSAGFAVKSAYSLTTYIRSRAVNGGHDEESAREIGRETFSLATAFAALKFPTIVKSRNAPIKLELKQTLTEETPTLLSQAENIFIFGSRGPRPDTKPKANSDFDLLIQVPDNVLLELMTRPTGAQSSFNLDGLVGTSSLRGKEFLTTHFGDGDLALIRKIILNSLAVKFPTHQALNKLDIFIYVPPHMSPRLFAFGLQTRRWQDYGQALTVLTRDSQYCKSVARQTGLH